MVLQGTAPQVGLRISLAPNRHGPPCCFRESAGPHLRQGVHTVTHREIPLHTNSIYIGVGLPGENKKTGSNCEVAQKRLSIRGVDRSYLVFQTHEAMSMIISQRGLRGITSDWVTGVSIGESLDREPWSCKHI